MNKAFKFFNTGLIVMVKFDDPDCAGIEETALIIGEEKNNLVISMMKDKTIGYIVVDNITLVIGITQDSTAEALNIIANWKGSIKPIAI